MRLFGERACFINLSHSTRRVLYNSHLSHCGCVHNIMEELQTASININHSNPLWIPFNSSIGLINNCRSIIIIITVYQTVPIQAYIGEQWNDIWHDTLSEGNLWKINKCGDVETCRSVSNLLSSGRPVTELTTMMIEINNLRKRCDSRGNAPGRAGDQLQS